MRILSMTATFGKLEHDSLKLEPGMNVIQAPNEWGKSTWCAFLMAMLYGLDTRAKSGRGGLADKERYAPWSGSPMSGRMEIEWKGREITVERSTRGRIPMGTFRAYETKTGVDVPELTAANCGQQLLGVEQSVFRRAGFIRLADMPVTQDDALRRRLHALVTTGDESADAAKLEKGLRELKNRCRYHQSGLLPQAEQERDAVSDALSELAALKETQQTLTAQLAENEKQQRALENHASVLIWQSAQRDVQKMEEAKGLWETSASERDALRQQCAQLPTRTETEARLEQLRRHRERTQNLSRFGQLLPPRMPRVPKPFLGTEPEEAMEQVEADASALRTLCGPVWWLLLAWSLACLAGGGVLLWQGWHLYAIVCGFLGVLTLLLSVLRKQGQDRGRRALLRKYGSLSPEEWEEMARDYESSMAEYRQSEENFFRGRLELEEERRHLEAERSALCGDGTAEQAVADCGRILSVWSALDDADRTAAQREQQYQILRSVVRVVPEPTEPDALSWNRDDTVRLLRQARQDQQHLLNLRGECRGRMNTLGDEQTLRDRLTALEEKIEKLKQILSAAELAQRMLTEAEEELQRRFSPRITRRAQNLLHQLTGGRYDRLSLGQDLTLRAGTEQEDTLHDAQWRSEGTVDQLYLALRLAVAEELTPEAPLILDDALVRFDQERMAAALEILKSISKNRQVLLLSCQYREQRYLQENV